MNWKVIPLISNKYHSIIGMNFLKAFQVNINVENQYIKIFANQIIPFVGNCHPPGMEEANQLEPIPNSNEEIVNQVNTNQLNNEEKYEIENLLSHYKDLFYVEGENLTFTHEIKHEIRLTQENPIYSKIYRYPLVHEKEIEKQVNEMLKQGIIRVKQFTVQLTSLDRSKEGG